MKKLGMIYKKISRIKPFTSQYKWKEINFPAKTKDWKMFETNSKTIDLDILFSLSKKRDRDKISIDLKTQFIA